MHTPFLRPLFMVTAALLVAGLGIGRSQDAATNGIPTNRYALGPVTNIVTGDIKAGIL